MRILITGSTGFLGNFLSEYFGKKGIGVIGLDTQPHKVVKDIPNFKFIKCDVRDSEKIQKIFKDEEPTHVIHLAYLMDPKHDSKFEKDVDVEGSKNTFIAANKTESVKQFILFSSTSIYGGHPDNPEWIKEEDTLRPADYNYAIYKKTVEKFYQNYKKREDMNLVILRMCTAVGPSYYKPGGVVSSFAKSPISLLVGKKENAVQFIHEDDVKALVEKIVNDKEVEGVFNLCPDSYSTVRELAKALGKRCIKLPLWLIKGIFGILWKLHIAELTPAMAKLMAYAIIATPKKIMQRYKYTFKYSTKQAFLTAIEQRKENGTL